MLFRICLFHVTHIHYHGTIYNCVCYLHVLNWTLSKSAPLVANSCRSVYIAHKMAADGVFCTPIGRHFVSDIYWSARVCHQGCWFGKWSIVSLKIWLCYEEKWNKIVDLIWYRSQNGARWGVFYPHRTPFCERYTLICMGLPPGALI